MRRTRAVGNGVLLACQIKALGQATVEHVQLALDIHRVPVICAFDLDRRVGIKMAKASAQKRRTAHLPEELRQEFGTAGAIQGQENAESFGQIHQDRTRFEHLDRHRSALIDQRWDLGVGVGTNKAAAELVAVLDADQPDILFGARVACGQQFLQHHRHLDALGRALRIELQGVASDREDLVMGRSSGRAIDAGEAATVFLGGRPDLGRCVIRKGVDGNRGSP